MQERHDYGTRADLGAIMSTTPSEQQGRSRPIKLLVGALVVGVLLAGVGLWWTLREDAPADVSLGAAIESVEGTADSDETGAVENIATDIDETDTTAVGAIAGTWTVDTESGDFDYESATGSFVGFRIEEELRGIGSTTAVGRTGDVTGTMVIEGSTVTEASFDIDMTTITTNSSMRDDNVQDALETGEFPSASFVMTQPMELDEGAEFGEAVTSTAVGDLTVHGVTNQISFAMEAQLVDGVVIAVGSTEITFSDYDVEVPNGGPVISVDDFGILELQFLLAQTANA